jgi:hypothetical protein
MSLWIKLGVAVCVTLTSSATWAGRPFTTEDAGVIDARNCELEAFGSHARAQSDPSERGAWAEVGCGIGFGTQLAFGMGRFSSADGSRSAAAASGKTALRVLSEDSFGMALAYTVDGSRTPGEPLRHTGSSASVIVSVPCGRTMFHANLGLTRNHVEGRNAEVYAFAVERLGEQGADVGVEVFGQSGEPAWVGAGARYAIEAEKLWVDSSLAMQSGGSHARQVTVGLKYAF